MGWLLGQLEAGEEGSLRLREGQVFIWGREEGLEHVAAMEACLGGYIAATCEKQPPERRWLALLGPHLGADAAGSHLDEDDLEHALRNWRQVRGIAPEAFVRGAAERRWPFTYLAVAARCAALCYRSGTLWELVLPSVFSASKDRRPPTYQIYAVLRRLSRRIAGRYPGWLVSQEDLTDMDLERERRAFSSSRRARPPVTMGEASARSLEGVLGSAATC